MSPIQQMLLGVGAVATKKYIEDAFLTYLYANNNSTQTTNFDLTENGGLLWIKNRTDNKNNVLNDTVRGATKMLVTNQDVEEEIASSRISGITSTGFTLGSDNEVRDNTNSYVAWNFARTPGFFDVVTYNGNSGAPGFGTVNLAHSLGCVPGLIILKRLDSSGGWWVYHKDLPPTANAAWNQVLRLDRADAKQNAYNLGSPSTHTATTFRIGNDNGSNTTGGTYVAYLFAGGESTAATARSVDFDGSNDKVSIPDSTDFEFGSGDFTIEAWVKQANAAGSGASSHTIVNKWHNTSNAKEWILRIDNGTGSNVLQFLHSTDGNGNIFTTGNTAINVGQWHHVAVVGHSGTIKLFVDGIQQSATSTQGTIHAYSNELIFSYNQSSSGQWMDGAISNCRIVKGTAVYTSSFRPPYEPLTNITNTKLLCLNNSSVTGSTVSPGTLTNNGATASTDSPFDDPDGFVFGDSGTENLIKCGSYTGNGNDDGPEIYLGWEPQWVLVKNTASEENWFLWDSMRGIVTGGNDSQIHPNTTGQEVSSHNRIDLTPTGFKVVSNDGSLNESGAAIAYVCIRRPDGYVGKPPELGTGVLNMVAGTSGDPTFKLGFVTDFVTSRTFASSSSWWTYARLRGTNYVVLNTNTAGADGGASKRLDFMNGFATGASTNDMAWGWKRHAGFDVVTFKGDGNNRQIAHSLGKPAEMVWIKNRSDTKSWLVGSSGLTSWAKYMVLNVNDGESTGTNRFNSTAPTATHFTVGTHNTCNEDDDNYLAMLFASVSGISSVGSYSGNGQTGSSGTFVTTGFQPRFILIKKFSGHGQDWLVYDSVRGFGTVGNNVPTIYLNENTGPVDSATQVEVSSTGFRLVSNNDFSNESGSSYIYYAHA